MDKEKVFPRWTAKVDFSTESGGCWLWTGSKDASGYGKFRIGDKVYYAATIAWLLYKNEEPVGHIFRTCGNHACVNPKHLHLGSEGKETLPVVLTEKQREERFDKAMEQVEWMRQHGKGM